MNHIDLFTGIGGWAIAAQRQGYTTKLVNDIEPWCGDFLQRKFPDAQYVADVHDVLDQLEFDGKVNLITGSPPCQPFSQANMGDRKLREDDSRYLWPQMKRIIQTLEPDTFVFENVSGTLVPGGEFEADLNELENSWEMLRVVVPASAVGAPHRRPRLFIIGRRTRGTNTNLRTPDAWAVPFTGPLSADGDKDRIKALGNAVVVPVVQSIIRIATSNLPLEQALKEFEWNPRHKPNLVRTDGVWKVRTANPNGRTPTASDYKGSTGLGSRRGTLVETVAINPDRWGHTHNKRTIYANPEFYEYVMGFPIGWTEKG